MAEAGRHGHHLGSLVLTHPPAFNGDWPAKVVCWGQIDYAFKLALLTVVAPSLYNAALAHQPLEVDAAVAYIFEKLPGSLVEVQQKNYYAKMLLTHAKHQASVRMKDKTREEVFIFGIDILRTAELEGISAQTSIQGMTLSLPPVTTEAVVVAHPGRRALLIQGLQSRELRGGKEGGAADWTVEAGYLCSPEAGLFISVTKCLADPSKPWPEVDTPTHNVHLHELQGDHDLHTRLHHTLELATVKAKRARLQLEQDVQDLDAMLLATEREVATLEAQAAQLA